MITDFAPGEHISYVVLARRLVNGACVTEYAGPYLITIAP